MADLVTVTSGDVLALGYADAAFDVVIAEAVTMFTDRPKAAAELARVTRPGGQVLATEFYCGKPPSPEAREIFLGEVCPGMRFGTVDDWVKIYSAAGLTGKGRPTVNRMSCETKPMPCHSHATLTAGRQNPGQFKTPGQRLRGRTGRSLDCSHVPG